MSKIAYIFQCMRCFIVSGFTSTDSEDAPSCCGGELMCAIPMEYKRDL